MAEEIFGKYTLLNRLAFGGMAEIYLARLEGQDGFRKTCVLKRILGSYSSDEEFVRMFINEAVLAARLNHPNVVQTYDFGDVDGVYYIAMEYIDGPDLRKLIVNATKKGRSLTVAEACALVQEMCRGLSYVHNLRDESGEPLQIVHRDISPHNVMVARAGQIKIMDFGIAKAALRASQTKTGTVKGKLAYMAPEQASAQPMDKRTDQFAVGLVLWECLTGARHFEGNSEPELFGKVLRGDIRDVREVRPDVPEELAHITSRMLQVAPGDRYADLADAEDALNAFRYSLGPEGAVRIEDVVAELAPPKNGTGGHRRPTSPSSRSNPSRSQSSRSGASRSQPSKGGTRALDPENGPGNTIALDSKDIVAPATKSGWDHTVGTPENELATRSIMVDPSPRPEHASSPSIRVRSDETMPTSSRSVPKPALFGGVAAAVLALIVAAAWMFSGDEPAVEPESPVVTPVSVAQPEPVPSIRAVELSSTPAGAVVVVDGKESGVRTPTVLKLENGTRLDVELRKAGFERWRKEIVVSPDLGPVEAKLVAKTRKADKPAPDPVPGRAELRVESTPRGATIYIDGKRSALRTPATLSDLEVGESIEIELRLKGHRNVSATVDLNAESQTLDKKLAAIPRAPAPPPPPAVKKSSGTGLLSLRTKGPWVNVYLGKKFLGPTPLLKKEVPAGRLTLRLVNEGANIDKTVTYDIKKGKELRRAIATTK